MSESEEDTNFESADEGDGKDDDKRIKKKYIAPSIDKMADDTLIKCQVDEKTDSDSKLEKQSCEDIANENKYDENIDLVKNDTSEMQNVQQKQISNMPVQSMTISSCDRGHDTSITDQPKINKFDHDKSSVDDSKLQNLFDDMSTKKEPKTSSGWGGWGGWGSSLLSTAAQSVSTFTTQVGEGLNTVLESVESSLGAPDPEELAKYESKEGWGALDAQLSENDPVEVERNETNEADDDLGGWLSWGALSNVVEKTGKTLVSGSLDVLETIGKKTYDAIGEGDHGLKQVIKKTGAKPNLSQVLRDAKEQYEQNYEENEKLLEERKVHFGSMFDEYNGLLHLEALENLSSQCEFRVSKVLELLPQDDVALIKPQLLTLRNVFDINDESDEEDEEDIDYHNFPESAKSITEELSLPLNTDKLVRAQEKAHQWLKDADEEQESGVKLSTKEIHQTAIQMLAEFTAGCVQHFHKVAQLVPLETLETPNAYIEKADILISLTKVMKKESEYIAGRFAKCLSHSAEQLENPNDVNPLMTSIYLECGNSKVYLEDALKLLLPILQERSILSHSDL